MFMYIRCGLWTGKAIYKLLRYQKKLLLLCAYSLEIYRDQNSSSCETTVCSRILEKALEKRVETNYYQYSSVCQPKPNIVNK